MAVEIPRKTLLAGAGLGLAAAAVAACSGGTSKRPAGEELTSTADVPVGSGVILGDVLVTQPVAGEYKGLSAVCTHNGCLVNEIADETIYCPCHGSMFSLDGEVVAGPAERPLEPVAIHVQGESIVLGT